MDIGYAGAFIGGLFALLSPCSVMLLPAFFAYAFGSASALFARTALFFTGRITTLIPLGVFSATLGSLVNENRDALIGGPPSSSSQRVRCSYSPFRFPV